MNDKAGATIKLSWWQRIGARGRWSIRSAAIIALLGGAYIGWWWAAARAVESGVALWANDQRAGGTVLEHAGLQLGGFPGALRASTGAFSIKRPDGGEWRGDGLEVTAPPWQPTTLGFRLPGQQRAVIPLGPYLDLVVKAEDGDGRLVLNLQGMPTAARLALHRINALPTDSAAGTSVAAVDRGVAGTGGVAVERLESKLNRIGVAPWGPSDPSWMLRVSAQEIKLPNAASLSLAGSIASVSLIARLLGNPDSGDPAGLGAWSRAGGSVEIESLDFVWGPLTMTASGTLTLDGELQPVGAVTAQITGYREAIEALRKAGQLRDKDAQTATSLLRALTPVPAGGDQGVEPAGGRPVRVPLSLRAHHLWLGPFKLMPVPRLSW